MSNPTEQIFLPSPSNTPDQPGLPKPGNGPQPVNLDSKLQNILLFKFNISHVLQNLTPQVWFLKQTSFVLYWTSYHCRYVHCAQLTPIIKLSNLLQQKVVWPQYSKYVSLRRCGGILKGVPCLCYCLWACHAHLQRGGLAEQPCRQDSQASSH